MDRLLRECRPPGPAVRIGPVPPDQAAVPVQDRLGRDEERSPPLPRDEAGEQGDQRPVRPAEARPGHLAAQHGQLMAQHEYLGVLRQAVHPVDAEELKGASGEAVEERQGHGPAAWPSASSLVKPGIEFLDPTGSRSNVNLLWILRSCNSLRRGKRYHRTQSWDPRLGHTSRGR